MQDEVNSPVNYEDAEDNEELTDDEEITGTSPPIPEKDASDDGGNHDESIVSDDPITDRVDAGGESQQATHIPEFYFGKIHSTGGPIDIDAAMGLAEEFSLISLNDDWDVLGAKGKKSADEIVIEIGGEDASGAGARKADGERLTCPEERLGDDEVIVTEEPMIQKNSTGMGDTAGAETFVGASSEDSDGSLIQDGDDATLEWLMKTNLMFVPNPSPVIPGEKTFRCFHPSKGATILFR